MRAWPLVALLLAACAPVLAGECKPPNLEEACVTALKNAKKTLDNTDATPDEKDAAADLILSYKNLVGGARIFENAYRRREGPGPMEDDFAKTVAKAQDYRDQHPTTAKTEPRNTVTPTGDPVTMGKLRYSELNTLLDPNPKAGEEKLDNRGGGTPEERNELGDEYAARGDPTGARRNYEKSLKLDPNNGETYSKLAQLKYQQGDGAGAVADAKKALALDPKNQLALLIAGHGDSISQGGSRIKFKADFGAVRDPDAALPPASGAGKNASAPGAGASSRAPAPTQAQVMPSESPGLRSPAEVLELRARERLRMKDYTGAVMAARQAVDLEPNRAKGWALLAESSNEAGNPKGALEAAKKALDLDPANAQALRAKAYAEYLLGDFRQAYVDALRAVTLEPQNGLGYLYLAMAEEKLGHTADALKHYEQAVALDTTLDPLAQEARKRLGGGSSSSLSPDARKHMVRGGAIAGSLILILLGLLGTAAGKQLTTTAKRLIAATESDQATVLEAARAVGPGTILGGNYRVTGELGRGGMGIVYDAVDETLQRRVAIKQLSRDGGATSDDLDRFLKEARLVASLKHPHLAEIYNVINEADLYLVFEYVDGEALDKVLSRNGRIPLPQARRLLSEVAAALDYAHGRKIIHRDLKPSNIMITKEGSAKVMDFGIAHQSQSGKGLTMTAASGTPPYMAPEQALGSVSRSSDLYALGVMAYEMVTGERPFPGPDYLEQKLQKRFLPPSQRNRDLRREFDAFFSRALEPDPTRRPEDAKMFLRGFEDVCTAAGRIS